MAKMNAERFADTCADARGDIRILLGEDVGPSDASWQDVAGTLATSLEVIASSLHQMRAGEIPAAAIHGLAALLGDE